MNVLVLFLLVVGPLIFFHELGHFIAARRFGVRCDRFSIGVGPVLFSFKRGETEYTVCALPLGGFVSMLGMQDDEQIAPEDKGRALTDKPVWQRMIISFAGPLANVLIPLPLFFIIAFGAAERPGATLGQVDDFSAAAEAGLQAGDVVTAVDGEAVKYFDEVADLVRSRPGEAIALSVERDGAPLEIVVTPEAVRNRNALGRVGQPTGQLGVRWHQFAAIVHVDTATAPAALAGVRIYDEIVAIDGQPVESWLQAQERLDGHAGAVQLSLLRPVRTADAFTAAYIPSVVNVALPVNGQTLAQLGLRSAQSTVFFVEPGSPAATAGLLPGDRIVTAGERSVGDLTQLLNRIAADVDAEWTLSVDRAGTVLTLPFDPDARRVTGDFNTEVDHVFIGFWPRDRVFADPPMLVMSTGERLGWAFGEGVDRTAKAVLAVVSGVAMIFTGDVDSSSLGGPIMIADVVGRAADDGVLALMRVAAILSVNLAVLNLLPVPGLDGGTLLLLVFEGIKRRPLSLRARQIINFIGIVSIVLLMLFAFKNDIERYWGDVANWLNS